MKLPWYVELDRWIRRNPTTAQTLKGCGALVIVLDMVLSFKTQAPWPGMALIAGALAVYFLVLWHYRSVLERAADKWREEH